MKSFKEHKKQLKSDKQMQDDGWEKETIEISCNCLSCQEHELDEMAKPSHNLNGMYRVFNKAHFDGKLETVPVKYASLKGKTGLASASWWVKRNGRYKQYRLNKLNWIKINSNVIMSEEYTGDILMHEMIHINMFMQEIARTTGDPSHGKEFLADKAIRERTYGRTIPVSDDVKHELSDNAAKKYGIFTYEKPDGKLYYHLYGLKNWTSGRSAMEEYTKLMLLKAHTRKVATQILDFKIRTGEIKTTLHLQTKVARDVNVNNPFTGYLADPDEKNTILKDMENMRQVKL